MTSAAPVKGNFVIGLLDLASSDREEVGTKAATLARLASRGFRVPEGFVITVAACDRILATPGMPADVSAKILSHLEELGDGPVAVRSSGTTEDLVDASFAGQYDTVLGVRGPEAVADAIARCLASGSSERVRAYRGTDARGSMAVLIQQMVPADVAGVAFTANPISGDREVLVSAVKGLGDRLVSGEVTPDEWVVRGDEVSCAGADEGALNQDQVHEIADLAKAVERLFDAPQDIEWAIAGGQVFLLQARPITALPVAPRVDVPSKGFWQKDTSHFPTPLTPFGASIYLPPLSEAFRRPAAEFGLMVEGVEQRSLGGEVYVHTIPFGGKDRPVPPPWAMWLAARLAPPLRRKARAAQLAIASGLPERILDSWEGEWRPAFGEEFRELKNVDLMTMDGAALLGHLDRAKDMLCRGMELHFQLVVPYYLAVYEFGVVCRELLGWDVVRALSLVTGTSQASSEPGRELAALAHRIAADPPACQAVTGPSGNLRARLRQSAPWAAKAMDEYLERYGHRTVNLDPGAPTWFERPELVAGLLIQQVRLSRADSARQAGRVMRRRSLGPNLPGAAMRTEPASTAPWPTLGGLTGSERTTWSGSTASRARFCAIAPSRSEDVLSIGVFWPMPRMPSFSKRPSCATRCPAEAMSTCTDSSPAERQRERGCAPIPVRRPTEFDPGPPPADLSPLPPALRLVNTATIQVLQLMVTPSKPQDMSNELRGVPGSPGRFSGIVRVVHDETEFAKLGAGEVLVAPVTSPPWSVLFLQAGAVVTDGGGVLSHTAVIAREYGIPAVLATGEATRRLCDGDLVTVDGTIGIVSIGARAVGSVDHRENQ